MSLSRQALEVAMVTLLALCDELVDVPAALAMLPGPTQEMVRATAAQWRKLDPYSRQAMLEQASRRRPFATGGEN